MRTFIENYLHLMKNCIRPHYEKLKPLKSGFIANSNFENNRDPWHEMVEPILLGESTSSIPKGSVKKMRLKDRLPTSKLTFKHKKKPTYEDRGSREGLKVRSESMKRESAASFPEVDSSGSQSRADHCSGTNAVKVGKTPSTSMNELRNASNATFLNNIKVPPKPPRAFQNRPAWRN